MDSKAKLYLQRAKNELDLAKAVFKLSTSKKLKLEFELKVESTFFSNVISGSYYCIFYSAKPCCANNRIQAGLFLMAGRADSYHAYFM